MKLSHGIACFLEQRLQQKQDVKDKPVEDLATRVEQTLVRLSLRLSLA